MYRLINLLVCLPVALIPLGVLTRAGGSAQNAKPGKVVIEINQTPETTDDYVA